MNCHVGLFCFLAQESLACVQLYINGKRTLLIVIAMGLGLDTGHACLLAEIVLQAAKQRSKPLHPRI